MSDARQHIPEFSDFEPEVDDATITRSWEKLKYLLPPEKKRRRILFFIRTGLGGSLAVLCALGLCLGTVLYLREVPEKEKTIVQSEPVQEETKITDRLKGKPENRREKPGTSTPGKESIQQKIPGPGKQEKIKLPVAGNSNVMNGSGTSQNHPVQGSTENTEIKNQATGIKQQNGTIINEAIPVTRQDPPVGSYSPAANPPTIINPADSFTDLSMNTPTQDTFLYLPPVPGKLLYERPEDPVRLSLQTLPTDRPRTSHWIIDIAGGINQARTMIGEVNKTETAYKKVSFSGSLGLAYRIGKWSVMGRFGFNGNTFQHDDEQVRGYKVVNKKAYTFTSPTSIDTTVSYLVAHSSTSSRASSYYNAGLGLGCRVFRERKTQLEMFVMLDMKSSVYRVTSRNYFGRDTLKYVQTMTSGPLQNQIIILDEDLDQQYTLLSWGLTPGITYSYFLRDRISLILRPSYFIQLSKNTFPQGLKDFQISQNNLYLETGVGFRL